MPPSNIPRLLPPRGFVSTRQWSRATRNIRSAKPFHAVASAGAQGRVIVVCVCACAQYVRVDVRVACRVFVWFHGVLWFNGFEHGCGWPRLPRYQVLLFPLAPFLTPFDRPSISFLFPFHEFHDPFLILQFRPGASAQTHATLVCRTTREIGARQTVFRGLRSQGRVEVNEMFA